MYNHVFRYLYYVPCVFLVNNKTTTTRIDQQQPRTKIQDDDNDEKDTNNQDGKTTTRKLAPVGGGFVFSEPKVRQASCRFCLLSSAYTRLVLSDIV